MADGVVLNAGAGGVTAATDDCGAAGHAQIVKLAVSADGSATAIPASANGMGVDVKVDSGLKSRSDTFTVAASGTTVDASANPLGRFGLQVKGTGAVPTSWTVILEGSLDNVNFTAILTHTNTTDTDGSAKWTGAQHAPCLYFRARCSAVVLGSATNIVATIVGIR